MDWLAKGLQPLADAGGSISCGEADQPIDPDVSRQAEQHGLIRVRLTGSAWDARQEIALTNEGRALFDMPQPTLSERVWSWFHG